MTGEMAAAGEVVTGTLLARAVEPGAGEHGEGAGGLCLNCGTRRVGGFCHRCGQGGHVHRTMGSIVHDAVHGVLHLEGKTWRTLPMLAFKPGSLTRRYIAGERARFVSPMAVFLFSVFLMFAVVANLPGWDFANTDLMKPGVAAGMAQARTKLAEEKARAVAAADEERARLTRAQQRDNPDPERIARLGKRVADAEQSVKGLDAAARMLPVPTTFDIEGAPPASADNWLEAKWRHAKENPQLLIYKLKTSAYKFSWALIPISLPFIWLLFPLRRDVGMYDHAVFATYSLSFMSLLVIVLAVLAALNVSTTLLALAGTFIPPFHIYKQLKYGYGLSRGGALWRTFLMLNFAIFTITTFVILLLWLGLAG